MVNGLILNPNVAWHFIGPNCYGALRNPALTDMIFIAAGVFAFLGYSSDLTTWNGRQTRDVTRATELIISGTNW